MLRRLLAAAASAPTRTRGIASTAVAAVAGAALAANSYLSSDSLTIDLDDAAAKKVRDALEQASKKKAEHWDGTVGLAAIAAGLPPILAGKKTCSVREYPLPKALEGKPILVLGTAAPKAGFASVLPDTVEPESDLFQCAGVIIFKSGSYKYESREAFDADVHRHEMASRPTRGVQDSNA